MSGILSGNPQALDVMNEPLKEAIYDLLDVPEFDAPGGKKQRRMPWIENFTPEPLAPRGFASRGGTDTTIQAQTVADTKKRRNYKKLKPRYFEAADGEKLELYHTDSTTNTFVVRRNGRGIARVSVIEDNNGLPKLTTMNIDPGYDAEQIESELTKYVKEYFPNARRPEGKARVGRKVSIPGFASRADNEVPLDTVDVTTPAGVSALKEQLQRSKDDNKTATFMYNGALRRVDVKNIYEKDGITYVDGFDKTRGAGRTFRVDRMEAATVIGTGAEATTVEPPREPREPVAPYTGKAAELFEGATSFQQVYERLMQGELVFFDFETTGIEKDENDVMTNGGKPVQLGIIRVIDGKVVERKNMYINPGQPLGGWSKDNLKRFDENGAEVPLTDEWLQQQPSIADAMAEALDFIGEDKVLGGQYQIFDQRVMEDALAGTGLEGRWKPAGFIDSKGIIDHLYEDNDVDRPRSNRLGALADHYGVELTNWHSADADAEASWGIVEAAIRRAAEREDSRTGAPVKRSLLNTNKTNGIHDNNHSTWQSQHTEWKSTMFDIAKTKKQAASEAASTSPGGITLSDTGRMPDVAEKSLNGPQWAEIAVRDFARHAPEQFTKSMNYTKPALRERIKNQVMAGSDGGKPGQWSARKAQLVAQKYRAAGGGYRGKPSKKQRSLKKWTKERWRTSDGAPAERPGGTRRYLPDAAWEKLTPEQRKATNRKKIEGSRAGKQFVSNTRNAARAGRQARKG
jgi:DNA polymerase III epsilon subunit-like protein